MWCWGSGWAVPAWSCGTAWARGGGSFSQPPMTHWPRSLADGSAAPRVQACFPADTDPSPARERGHSSTASKICAPDLPVGGRALPHGPKSEGVSFSHLPTTRWPRSRRGGAVLDVARQRTVPEWQHRPYSHAIVPALDSSGLPNLPGHTCADARGTHIRGPLAPTVHIT